MNKVKAAGLAGVLSIGMAASMLAGCGSVDGTKAALVINDDTVSVGTASFLLRYQQAETTYMMKQYGMTSGTALWDTSYTASSSDSASTYGEQYKESTKKNIIQEVLLRQHAGDYSITISDDQEKSLKEAAKETYKTNEDAMKKIGVSEKDIVEALELKTYEKLMYDPMVADTDKNVTDDEAAQSTITYARVPFSSTDSSGNSTTLTDAEKATCKTELETLISQVNASGDPAKADISTMASTLDSTHIQVSSDSFGDDDTALPDEVKNAALTLSDGQIYGSVIETTDYYYIVRLDAKFDKTATETQKQTIISQREEKNYTDKLQKWQDAAKITVETGWKDLTVTDEDGYTMTEPASSSSSTSSETTTSTSAGTTTSTSSGTTTSTSAGTTTSTSAGTTTTSTSTSAS